VDAPVDGRAAGEPLTTTDVCHEIVKPVTEQWKCAFWQLVPARLRGPVTTYLSHAWKMDYFDVYEATRHTLSDDPEASVFFCLVVNNQWASDRDMTFAEMELTFRASLECARRPRAPAAPPRRSLSPLPFPPPLPPSRARRSSKKLIALMWP
jgi:hypothetical protein